MKVIRSVLILKSGGRLGVFIIVICNLNIYIILHVYFKYTFYISNIKNM